MSKHTSTQRQVENIRVEFIDALPGRRAINQETVDRLAVSIQRIGLRTPITVRLVDDYKDSTGEVVDGQPILVTGAHRLEAVRKLGWDHIECFIFDGDDEVAAQLWEISENLHRAELTPLERSELIAEWITLTEKKEKPSQVGTVSKGGRGKSGGINAAARELGISKTAAHRAVKIAALPERSKQAAKEAGLDRNQSALEKMVKTDKPAVKVAGKNSSKPKVDAEKVYQKAAALLPDMDRKGLADLAFRCIDLIARSQDEAAYQELCRLYERATEKLLPIRDALTVEAARKKRARQSSKTKPARSTWVRGTDPETGDPVIRVNVPGVFS